MLTALKGKDKIHPNPTLLPPRAVTAIDAIATENNSDYGIHRSKGCRSTHKNKRTDAKSSRGNFKMLNSRQNYRQNSWKISQQGSKLQGQGLHQN